LEASGLAVDGIDWSCPANPATYEAQMSRELPSTSYIKVDAGYFEKRGLRRYAGIWSLWALGVGAVISGHFSGWNYGLATG